jgi:hypothetical protein
MDTSDPLAGPQLLIGEVGRIRCLNMRSQMLTTLAGDVRVRSADDRRCSDGPVSAAQLNSVYGMVGPNGAVFISQRFEHCCVRRISPAPRGPTAQRMERMVTTLVGGGRVRSEVLYAQSSAPSFQAEVRHAWLLALHAPSQAQAQAQAQAPVPFSAAMSAAVDPDCERDGGCLYVFCDDGVHAFDLQAGTRRVFQLDPHSAVHGLAVNEDGTRLFAVSPGIVYVFDMRTGTRTALIAGSAVAVSDESVLSAARAAAAFKEWLCGGHSDAIAGAVR